LSASPFAMLYLLQLFPIRLIGAPAERSRAGTKETLRITMRKQLNHRRSKEITLPVERGKGTKFMLGRGSTLRRTLVHAWAFQVGIPVDMETLPRDASGIGPKAFVVRAAKATTSNLAYKCFTAWKEVSGPFSIRAEGTI
jgi:hypothetical protein